MSGQRKRTVFVRRLCLHGRRVACGRRAVNLRKYPSRVNFSNQRQFRVSSFKFRDARGEPLAEGCRPCRDSGFIKRAFPALKGWAKLFRPTGWDWNPRLSPETGANPRRGGRRAGSEALGGAKLYLYPEKPDSAKRGAFRTVAQFEISAVENAPIESHIAGGRSNSAARS